MGEGEQLLQETLPAATQSDTGLIVFIAICAFLLFVVLAFGIMNDRKRKDVGVYGNLKKQSIFSLFYNFFVRLFLTRRYVLRVRQMYLSHCPMEPERLNVKTIKVCFGVWAGGMLILYLVFMRNPSIYNMVLAIFLISVVSIELVRFISKAMEKKILRQLEKFLNDVRHFYYDTHSVVASIQEAAGQARYELRIHAERLCEVLTAADVKDAAEEYNQSSSNRFLKLFLSQCVATQEYGDTLHDGESLFIRNINDLRADILNYLLQLERLQLEFAGLTFITVIPVLTTDAIKDVAIEMLPELEAFYSGAIGVLAPPIFLCITILIYIVIIKMQELDAGESGGKKSVFAVLARVRAISNVLDVWEDKNYGKVIKQRERLRRAGERISPRQWLLQKVSFALMAFFVGIWLFSVSHYREREVLSTSTDNIASLSSAATLKQVEQMKEVTIRVVNHYKDVEGVGELTLLNDIKQVIDSNVLADVVAKECMRRITEYQDSYLKWYELVFVLILSVGAFYIPLLLIKYKESLMKMNMLSEVTTFQSIIMMQMYIPDITVPTILTSMEQFALIFRASLQDCINELSFSWQDALENMKEKERYEPFGRLCDNFIIADKIGIGLAFEEIAQDREHFQKQRDLDTERMIKQKSGRAKLIAFIPLVVIILAYLIVPFGVESYHQFTVIMNELK